MKAKKIYGMAKQSRNLLVLIDESRQFFDIGGDIYLIDGMPYMEDAEFLAYLDVPKHKRDEWDVVPKYMMGTHEASVLGDMAGDDRELKQHPISITVGGKSYMAFLTEDGAVLWLDEDKLSPLAQAERMFVLRHSETGESYIAVKEGLYLVALLRYELTLEIMPGEGLAGRLLELAGRGQRTEGRPMTDDEPGDGEWIQQMRPYEDEIECSVCNERFNIIDNCTEKFDFCPHCGEKMKDGDSDA